MRYKNRLFFGPVLLPVCLLVGTLLLPLEARAQSAPEWTLSETLRITFEKSPVLRGLQAEREKVAGQLVGAKRYPHNPEVSLEVGNRSSPGGSTTDHGLSVSQEFELAGQRRQRVSVAEQELAAAQALLVRQKQVLASKVESAFADAVMARELLVLATTDADLAREVLAFSRRRLERGAATQIEVNLALASAGRAERALHRTRAAFTAAQSRLAEIAGLSPRIRPVPIGSLDLPEPDDQSLEDLLTLAFELRSDLVAAGHREQAAEAAIRLASAEAKPSVVLGAFFQQEESTDDIVGATIGFSVPLFNRNQGEVAESRATREQFRHERGALRLAIEQEVVTAFNKLQAARAAAEHLRDQVLGTLDESVELLQLSFEAGRVGATEVVTLRREFIASRREYIEAIADAWQAQIDLNLAVGRLTLPRQTLGEEPS